MEAMNTLSVKFSEVSITDTTRKYNYIPTPLDYGENAEIQDASAALSVIMDPKIGKHIVTNRNVKMGDILFVSKPFAKFVFPKNCNPTRCHECCKITLAPIPCSTCTELLYCSNTCQAKSWKEYHNWECGHLLNKKMSCLALRMALIGIYRNDFEYTEVNKLASHSEKMDTSTLFCVTAVAVMLIIHLEKYTNFFASREGLRSDKIKMGGRILHHLFQCIRYTFDMSKRIGPSEQPKFNTFGEAFYNSMSLLKNSCQPNTIRTFINGCMIIRASEDIPEGEGVYISFGMYVSETRSKRQSYFLKNFFFECECTACRQPQECFFDRFEGARCTSCSGPVVLLQPDTRQCADCSSYNSQLVNFKEMQEMANRLFEQGICALKEHQDFRKASVAFKACLHVEKQVYYKHHRCILWCAEMMYGCLALMEEFDKCIEILVEYALPAVVEANSKCDFQYVEVYVHLIHMMEIKLEKIPHDSLYYRLKEREIDECYTHLRGLLEMLIFKYDAIYLEWNPCIKNGPIKEMLTKLNITHPNEISDVKLVFLPEKYSELFDSVEN